MYSIVLVDDHAIVREGFKRLIELESDLEVVAECRNGDDAVEAVGHWRPDLVALDLSLPDGSGLPLIEHLLSVHAATRVVVLSMHDGDAYVSEALRRGASGFVTTGDRKSVVEGKRVSVRVDLGGRRSIKKKKKH